MKARIATMTLCAVLAVALIGGAGFARADDYPNAPINMIVTYSPGGATDFQARIVTMLSSNEEYFGQPVVIINKPGAGGKVGWNWMMEKAPLDGYTLCTYNVPHFIAQSVVYETKYAFDTFEPLANWGADPAVLIVPKDSPFTTLKAYLDYAKKNPGKITVNGAGLYVGHHIAALQLMKAADVKLTYIPEQGGAPAMQSVVAAKVKSGFNNLSDAYRNQERVRILAIADLERNQEFLPDVPTFVELGFAKVDNTSVNYRGAAFPKGVPAPIVEKCAKTFEAMFKAGKVISMMKNGGCPVKVMTREETIRMFAERQRALSEIFAKK